MHSLIGRGDSRLPLLSYRKSRQAGVSAYTSGDPKADRKALKRALKEGRAAEELLDRRSKLKSDKFA